MHIKYLSYIIRHKWFVIIAGLRLRRRGHRISLWRLLVHDASKFLPSEWIPYAEYFYGNNLTAAQINAVWGFARQGLVSKETWERRFNKAWLYHQHRNPHHWQYWVLREDDGETIPMEMPAKYLIEMVADWMGAGRAITGKWEASQWYLMNRDKMLMARCTRYLVERMFGISGGK